MLQLANRFSFYSHCKIACALIVAVTAEFSSEGEMELSFTVTVTGN